MNDFWSVVSEKRSKKWKKSYKIPIIPLETGVAPLFKQIW